MVTDTEDRNSDKKDSVMPLLIYPKEFDDKEDYPCEYLSDPPYAEPTPDLGPPREKSTKEPTLKSDFDALSVPSAPTREGSMAQLHPK